MTGKEKILGIDIGSISISVAELTLNKEIIPTTGGHNFPSKWQPIVSEYRRYLSSH